MNIINGQHLTYNHSGDAGYDLHLNLKTSSVNSRNVLYFLDKAHSANLNWHKSSGGYLPKLYLNGNFMGDYENRRDLDKFLNTVREKTIHGEWKYLEPFVILPPARVSYPELASGFANYLNNELVSTSFDFVEHDTKLKELLARNILCKDTSELKLEDIFNIAGFVYPRSGLGSKHQIAISNNVGVIDIGYRNNVMVALENRGRDIHMFTNGCRIAQLVLAVILNNGYNLEPIKGSEQRGLGGFGSTGINT